MLEYEASDAWDIKADTLLDQTHKGTAAKMLRLKKTPKKYIFEHQTGNSVIYGDDDILHPVLVKRGHTF